MRGGILLFSVDLLVSSANEKIGSMKININSNRYTVLLGAMRCKR